MCEKREESLRIHPPHPHHVGFDLSADDLLDELLGHGREGAVVHSEL
jgi:hypothetical protein